MTNHHIPAEQMIVEPFEERRAEQYSYMGNGTLSGVYEPKKWCFKLLCEETK